MLKFQEDYTTLIATFEDFILLVYVMVDDLYQQFLPLSVSRRRNVSAAKMSDSEIIALSICSEVVGMDSEKAWYSFVKRNYWHLFHALITLEGYITAFEITPASADDQEGLRDLAEKHLGLVVLGDKGYTGERLLEDFSALFGNFNSQY